MTFELPVLICTLTDKLTDFLSWFQAELHCYVLLCILSEVLVLFAVHIVFSDGLVDSVVLKCSTIWVMADTDMNMMEEWGSKYL